MMIMRIMRRIMRRTRIMIIIMTRLNYYSKIIQGEKKKRIYYDYYF